MTNTGRRRAPAPIFHRLRILAREASRYAVRLGKLPPVYSSCPVRCIAPEADPANGCPDCEVTVAFESFRKDFEREIRSDIRRELEREGFLTPAEIPGVVEKRAGEGDGFTALLFDYRELRRIEETVPTDQINPNWTIRTEEAIRVIREEREAVRREEDYELEEKLKAARRAREVASRGR